MDNKHRQLQPVSFEQRHRAEEETPMKCLEEQEIKIIYTLYRDKLKQKL
jgi:hypothetical protein